MHVIAGSTLLAHEKRAIYASSSSARAAKLKSITLSFLGIFSHMELWFVMLAYKVRTLVYVPDTRPQLVTSIVSHLLTYISSTVPVQSSAFSYA